jgi:hypothetical protein
MTPLSTSIGLCLATVLLAAAPARPQHIDLDTARDAFEQARAASEVDAGRLWNRTLYGPMLFVEPSTRLVVANRADFQGVLTEQDGIWVGRLPEQENIANTATEWAGVRWTMLIWPLPEDRRDRTRLLIHECFHRIQDDLGLPGGNPANEHLDGRTGRTWLRLEWRALGRALMMDGEARRRAVGDALAFRAHRRALLPDAAAEERALEMNEGLAEDTGQRLGGWPEEDRARRAALALRDKESSDKLMRSFAYVSGPAYGALLDAARPDWRAGLSSDDDLGALLAEALDVTVPDDLAAHATQRAADYDGETVMAEEEQRAQARQAAIERNVARFVDGPVLVLSLGSGMSYSFNPNQIEALEGHGSVYAYCRVTDEWGILEVTGGALLNRDEQGRMTQARVPAPADATGSVIDGEGWRLTLEQGWTLAPGAREGDLIVQRAP